MSSLWCCVADCKAAAQAWACGGDCWQAAEQESPGRPQVRESVWHCHTADCRPSEICCGAKRRAGRGRPEHFADSSLRWEHALDGSKGSRWMGVTQAPSGRDLVGAHAGGESMPALHASWHAVFHTSQCTSSCLDPCFEQFTVLREA
eukprot:361935-Chlamydomonas_euryale.AAC.7